MGHEIQVIIATSAVADAMRRLHPEIPHADLPQSFVALPVEADFVDSITGTRSSEGIGAFARLTGALHDFLLDLSRIGPLAYVETEYFGGNGGQGAVVYGNGQVTMGTDWRDSGPINDALKLLGVKRPWLGDRFSALNLDRYRSNEDLVDLANIRRDQQSRP